MTHIHQLRRDRPLTDDEMFRVAPSIFAQEPHHTRSERYLYIPTIEILRGLQREGFEPFTAAQSVSRTVDKRQHAKHMLRLRQVGQGAFDQDTNEIILINSHDGSSSYKLMAGMFRFVCCNGLIIGDTHSDFTVRHQGDVQGQVIEGAYTVVENFEKLDERRDLMQSTNTTREYETAFARAALALRYEGEPEKAPILPEQLLVPRRQEDDQRNMWSTFNRVQENMLKGGLRGQSAHGRRTRTREVKSIDNNVSLNRSLWVLAEEMSKLLKPVEV